MSNYSSEVTTIREFFNEKSIFITGATGFLGKFVLEKLLSTTNVSKIYFLIRSNKRYSIEERTEILKNNPLFKFRTPKHMLDRLSPVEGDITLDNLGIDAVKKTEIENNVSIVIHIAATINFVEPLKNAMMINVFGTNEVIKLCKNMKNLKSFIHVSTAYTNVHVKQTGEEYIPVAADPELLIKMMNDNDEDTFNKDAFELYREGHETTYTFTKNLAEKLVVKKCIKHSIPCTIVRPSVIVAPCDKVLEYYADDYAQASTMFIMNFAMGLNRVFPSTPDTSFSIVPVDMAANTIIVCAWKVAMEHKSGIIDDNGNVAKPSFDPNIYGVYFDYANQVTMKQINEGVIEAAKKYPPMNMVRPPNMTFFFPKNTISHQIAHFWFNTLFALVFDLIIPRKTSIRQLIKKSVDGLDTMTSFMKDWSNDGQKFPEIYKELKVKDKHLFDCTIPNDIRDDTFGYIEKYWLSIRKWVLKEDISNVKKARQNMFVVKIVYYFIMTIVFLLLVVATTLIVAKHT